MKLTALLQVRWEQKDSHSAEVQGQTAAGDHVSESHLLLADRHPADLPIGPASANEGITNRKSVPPGHEKDDLSLVSCQNSWVFFLKDGFPCLMRCFSIVRSLLPWAGAVGCQCLHST